VADIEAEIEKLLPCKGSPQDSLMRCDPKYAGDWVCNNCLIRPAVAEFCRGLVADKDNRIAELEQRCFDYENEIAESCPEDFSVKETVDALRAKVAELEQDLEVYKDLYAQKKEVYALSVKRENELVGRIAELEQELDRERMRLAACGVAAMANTTTTVAQRIGPDHPYYSASYGDVCRAVDREMDLRAQLTAERASRGLAICTCGTSDTIPIHLPGCRAAQAESDSREIK